MAETGCPVDVASEYAERRNPGAAALRHGPEPSSHSTRAPRVIERMAGSGCRVTAHCKAGQAATHSSAVPPAGNDFVRAAAYLLVARQHDQAAAAQLGDPVHVGCVVRKHRSWSMKSIGAAAASGGATVLEPRSLFVDGHGCGAVLCHPCDGVACAESLLDHFGAHEGAGHDGAAEGTSGVHHHAAG